MELNEKQVNEIISKEFKRQGEIFEQKFTPYKTEFKTVNDIVYIVSYATIEENAKMHRYLLMAWYWGEKLYQSSNVIDNTAFYSLEECQVRTKSYFQHYINKM